MADFMQYRTWKPRKIKAETAEEIEGLKDPRWVRKRLLQAVDTDPVVQQVYRLAQMEGLSGEEFYVYLAYHALVVMEETKQAYLEYVNLQPSPPIIIPR